MSDKYLRLLVVDDQESWRYVIKLQFEGRSDVSLSEASSKDDAIEQVRVQDFDLVLLDMRMPSGTEGLDALSEIKKLKPNTQVIVMTAYGDVPHAVDAMRRGALDFILKEGDFDDALKSKVNEFIRTSHLSVDRELLIQSTYRLALEAQNPQEKGKALESLLSALLSSIDGFIEIGRDVNTLTEEIDIVFRNESRDPTWQRESTVILVECKNWASQRVGKNEFVIFKEKMLNRVGRCELGFLVCTANFAETVQQEMLRSSKANFLVVPVDGTDLGQLVEARNRGQVLRNLVDRALLI